MNNKLKDQVAQNARGASVPADTAPSAPVTVPSAGAAAPSISWKAYLEKNRDAISAVLPSMMRKSGGVDRMIRMALTVLRRQPQLLNCSMPSLMGALLECSAVGLEPNSPLHQAYIVPFNNKRTRSVEATVIIGYRGLIDLHYRSGVIDTIYAQPVYEKDEFSIEYGTNEGLHHKFDYKLPRSERGDFVGVYAYARLKGGAYRFNWLSAGDVRRIRDEFSAGFRENSEVSPWNTHFAKMAMKTAVRDLSDYLPRSAEVQRGLFSDGFSVGEKDPFAMQYDEPEADPDRADLDPSKKI